MRKIIYFILTITLCSLVSGSLAPPALPSEFWGVIHLEGNPVADGTLVQGFVGSTEYTKFSLIENGYYHIVLSGGDSDLTFLDDPNCIQHDANNKACFPCSTDPNNENYCIEGPQDGQTVYITANGRATLPTTNWINGLITELNLTVFNTGQLIGKVDLNRNNNTNNVSIILRNIADLGTYRLNKTINQSGHFKINNLPSGLYDIWIKPKYYLAVRDIVVMTPSTEFNFGTAKSGDYSDTGNPADQSFNAVDFIDIAPLANGYGSDCGNPKYYWYLDPNEDCIINFIDIAPFSNSYGSGGASIP